MEDAMTLEMKITLAAIVLFCCFVAVMGIMKRTR
jgi:hypothetical protein